MATEAKAPASQSSDQQLSTGASVEGGDIKLEVVPPLYTSVLFCPAPKVILNLCLIALSNGSGSAQFSPIHTSNGASAAAAWVQVRALQLLNTTEDFYFLGVNWKEAQSS